MVEIKPFQVACWEADTEARRQDRQAQQDRDRRKTLWVTAAAGGAALLLAPLDAAAGFPFVILALAPALLAVAALCLILH